MPCLVALLALLSPRLAIIAVALTSDILSRSMDGWLLPFLGFFLLPWTTLAYALLWNLGVPREVAGFEWFILAFAFLVDLGAVGGSRRAQANRSSKVY